MIIHNPILTGSFTVNGVDALSITGSAASLTSLNAATASLNSFSASMLTFTASAATTGSNTFVGNQVVTGSLTVTGSITTPGTLTAQTLVVQTVTSSVVYSSGSNVFGNNIANTQTFTGSVSITGSTNLTGALNGTSATFAGNVIIRPSSGYNALFQINSTALRINYLNDAQDTNISAAYRAADFAWQNSSGASAMVLTSGGDVGIGNTAFASTRLTVTGKDNTSSNYAFVANNASNNNLFLVRNDGAIIANTAFTMQAYSFASSAIQFTRANTNTVAPGSGNGILVFAGGNAQMRMDTSNGINFDMFNSGTTHTALKIQQNGNTVLVNSPDNTLSLGLGYQGTIHGYLGGFSSRLEAYSNNGGYVFLSSGSAWIAASDVKRKRNFETYSLGLDAILGLQPKLYNMDFQQDEDEKQVGLVAQEVKDFIPLAYEENNNFIGLNYNTIIVTLINAVKELKAEIDELKNK
jgi:hypothetical protein